MMQRCSEGIRIPSLPAEGREQRHHYSCRYEDWKADDAVGGRVPPNGLDGRQQGEHYAVDLVVELRRQRPGDERETTSECRQHCLARDGPVQTNARHL